MERNVTDRLQPVTLQEAEALLVQLQGGGGCGAEASASHLKVALYDWRVEQLWGDAGSYVFQLDGLGYQFFRFTTAEPRHCTLRHFFVLEQARGQRVGARMMALLHDHCLQHRVRYLRFFANKPSMSFYEKLGYRWHGVSKTGLPFTYWDMAMGKLARLPTSQHRFVVQRTLSSLTIDRSQV